MKTIIEKNPDAPGLARASSIASALLRYHRVDRFVDLPTSDEVELTGEQWSLLRRSRRHLGRLTRRPEVTLAVCAQCGAAYTRVPGASMPKRCTLSPGCTGRVVWAGRAAVRQADTP